MPELPVAVELTLSRMSSKSNSSTAMISKGPLPYPLISSRAMGNSPKFSNFRAKKEVIRVGQRS
eukprot:8102125-Prorocentrum_lima.AAC.1